MAQWKKFDGNLSVNFADKNEIPIHVGSVITFKRKVRGHFNYYRHWIKGHTEDIKVKVVGIGAKVESKRFYVKGKWTTQTMYIRYLEVEEIDSPSWKYVFRLYRDDKTQVVKS